MSNESESGLASESNTLAESLTKHEIEIPDEQREQIEAYCAALWEWNEKINLTRHTTFDLFVTRDLLDTIRLANQLEQNEEVPCDILLLYTDDKNRVA